MKNKITVFAVLISLFVLIISCDSSPSLQKYYVDNQGNNEFIMIDLPTSILELKDQDVSEEMQLTLNSIKKLNFLALELKDDNKEMYETEKRKISAILKNPKYKELMHLNNNKNTVNVKYLGEDDAIDEVVFFGSDNEKGFALVRVLGDNMNPAQILKLTQEIKIDGDNSQLKDLMSLMSKK